MVEGSIGFDSPRDLEAAQAIGPVVFRCRRRSQKEIGAALSGISAGSYVTPIVLGLICALGAILAFALPKGGFPFLSPPEKFVARSVAVVAFGLATALGFWWTFHRPRTPTLVLHAQGFRERGQVIAFDDVAGIWLGREPTAADRRLAKLAEFSQSLPGRILIGRARHSIAGVAAKTEASRRVTVIIMDKAGERHTLRDFLIHYDEPDIHRFLGEVRRCHPEIVIVGEFPTQPGVDPV